MKTINVTFTDEEHDQLSKSKDELSWHDFILKIDVLEDLLRWYQDNYNRSWLFKKRILEYIKSSEQKEIES